jgi:hypothetical protein
VSYADTIIEIQAKDGAIALSAYKIRAIRKVDAKRSEVRYSLSDQPGAQVYTLEADQTYDELVRAWKTGCSAWQGSA